MEPLSLVARSLCKEAKLRKWKEAQEEHARQMASVGINPFTSNSKQLIDAVSFLEEKVLEAASNGEDCILVPYHDIPGVAERMKKVESFPSVSKRDLSLSIRLIQEAFRAKNPDFVAQSHNDPAIVVHAFTHLKISF